MLLLLSAVVLLRVGGGASSEEEKEVGESRERLAEWGARLEELRRTRRAVARDVTTLRTALFEGRAALEASPSEAFVLREDDSLWKAREALLEKRTAEARKLVAAAEVNGTLLRDPPRRLFHEVVEALGGGEPVVNVRRRPKEHVELWQALHDADLDASGFVSFGEFALWTTNLGVTTTDDIEAHSDHVVPQLPVRWDGAKTQVNETTPTRAALVVGAAAALTKAVARDGNVSSLVDQARAQLEMSRRHRTAFLADDKIPRDWPPALRHLRANLDADAAELVRAARQRESLSSSHPESS